MEEFADVSQTDALVLPVVEWWVDDAARIVKIIVAFVEGLSNG